MRWSMAKRSSARTARLLEHKDKTITLRSRTFFHATLDDNPALSETGYGATIDAPPEPCVHCSRDTLTRPSRSILAGDPDGLGQGGAGALDGHETRDAP